MKTKMTSFLLGILLSLNTGLFNPALSQQTLTLRPGPDTGQDCEIRTDWPATPVGWSPSLCAITWTVGGNPVIIRGLLRFDLTKIPVNATILSATLSLFCNPQSTHYQLQSGDNQSWLMRVLEPWDQDVVTWNTQPAATFDSAILLPTSSFSTQSYPDIDVTSHVRYMVSHPEENFGWKLQLLTEELYRSMELSSSNDDESYRPILVINYRCSLEANFSCTIQVPTVTFTDSSSSGHTWSWDFGDGYFSNLQNPVHTYLQQGNYSVCLIVTDSCGSDTVCRDISVCDALEPRFFYQQANQLLSFFDSSFHAIAWSWDFGDYNYSNLQNPIHYYLHPGTYNVCLTSTNLCQSETVCETVSVFPAAIGTSTEKAFRIRPNPSHDRLFVEPINPASNSTIMVISADGRMMLKETPFDGTPVNTSIYPNGIYFIQYSCSKEVVRKKFVVSHP